MVNKLIYKDIVEEHEHGMTLKIINAFIKKYIHRNFHVRYIESPYIIS